MDHATKAAYESHAAAWRDARHAQRVEMASELADADSCVLDLGCGPGFHLPHLGPHSIGVDLSRSMLDIARSEFGQQGLVQADLSNLPFRTGAAGAAWASKSYVHLRPEHLPIALHDAHRVIRVEGRFVLRLFCGDISDGVRPNDEFGPRRYTFWHRELLESVIEGAGFVINGTHQIGGKTNDDREYDLRRTRTLADTVGPNMRVLLVGLNPSLRAADAGVGFIGPSNRFWRAATTSGLISEPRNPRRALEVDGIGMTDLVKRATTKASEIGVSEFRAGLVRLERLSTFLEPDVICVVGITGWRAATGRDAVTGYQDRTIGGRPVYLMPNPSGLNAHTNHDDLVNHFRHVLNGERRG